MLKHVKSSDSKLMWVRPTLHKASFEKKLEGFTVAQVTFI